ncbi:retention module-containing protein, partial [Oceanisphaera marina]|uniref:retention module-containing protein n=1 Tax=Oceanisphaera marina TaxID=2017550 RepID=UPI001664AA0F
METTRIDTALQIVDLQGRAFVIAHNGAVTPVTIGQTLMPGSLLLTDSNTHIVYGDAPSAQAAVPVNDVEATADIIDIQAAILAGLDPSELFDPAAAGNPAPAGTFTGSSGNAGFVVVERVGDSLLAEAGFDTTFANGIEPFVIEELDPLLAADNDNDIGNLNSIPELTIDIDPPLTPSDSFPQSGNNAAFVEESALPGGSNANSNNESVTGQFNINTGNDALDKLELQQADGTWVDVTQGGQVTGIYGAVTITLVNGEYQWRYDLTGAIDHPGANKTGADDVLQENFAVRVTDDDGDQANADLTINILDDGPVAIADSNNVNEGGLVSGNVLTGTPDTSEGKDVFGADGAAAGGGVMGVAVGDSGVPVSGNLGAPLIGQYGALILNADGSYSYTSNANGTPPQGATDVFTYTIQDGDGDLSTTTLTINLTDSGLVIEDPLELKVYEQALDLDKTGADLAPGTVEGSAPSDPRETATGQVMVSGGVGPLTYTLMGSEQGTYGQIQLNADGSYTYTLTSPVTSDPKSNDGSHTELGKDSFSYTVTDANGNTQQGTILINIVDDVPSASADMNEVNEGGTAAGNVLTDGTADVFGADGAAAGGGVVGVAVGDTGAPVSGNLGAPLTGQYGALILNADGSYSYTSNANGTPPQGATDVFTYTIQDGDGDLSTTTLTINLTDSGLVIEDPLELKVYEQALDLDKTGADLAPGTVEGSAPSDPRETATGQVMVSGGVGPLTYTLMGSEQGTYGQIQLNADGSYTYTLTSPVTSDPKSNDGSHTELGKDSFSYTVTDANGNTQQGTILINIVDDAPSASADMNEVNEGGTAAGNVLTDGKEDVFGADGAAAGGGVMGVAVGDIGAPVSGNLGAPLIGQYGAL